MSELIDISFNFFSDTPPGKDPDIYSPTLRRYHKILWSKPLPSGIHFELNETIPRVLHHKSELGEFILSSDGIGRTFKNLGAMYHVINQVPTKEMDDFYDLCSTIGAYMIFPFKRVDNKLTINAARGFNQKISDRFDLTLECIRRYYKNEDSPLGEVLKRYASFFDLFQDFKGYVDFFLLQDLVLEDYSSIVFHYSFKGFENTALLNNLEEYQTYKKNLIDFVVLRNKRIHKASLQYTLNNFERH